MKSIVLAGNPVEHSYSPFMHNAAFRALGLQHEYEYSLQTLRSDELAEFVTSIAVGDLEGANVTIPHKQSIMVHLSKITRQAQSIGSVNTLYREDDTVVGCNTDMLGLVRVFRKSEIEIKGASAVVLGAGGAARSVVYALASLNAENVLIYNRTLSKARKLVEDFENHFSTPLAATTCPLGHDALWGYDLLLNCTPVGMKGHSAGETPIKKELLHDHLVVMDLVYNPVETRLLRDANSVGCRTVNGIALLIQQGAASFETWTGLKPPVDVMRNELLRKLEGESQ
ncbi:MAG: shikimate dehydrogenase [Candidatus Thorarchaeota archaeon]|nr:shikimate dehydrogenase [Candidatus Thorarchaeota archaeon]